MSHNNSIATTPSTISHTTIQSPTNSTPQYTPSHSFSRPPSSPLLPPNIDINKENTAIHDNTIDLTNDTQSYKSHTKPVLPLPNALNTTMTLQQHHSRIQQCETLITEQQQYITQLQCQVQELQNQLNQQSQHYITLQSQYNSVPDIVESILQRYQQVSPAPYLQRLHSTDTQYSMQSAISKQPSKLFSPRTNIENLNTNNHPSLTVTRLQRPDTLTPTTPNSYRSPRILSVSPAPRRRSHNSNRSSLNSLASITTPTPPAQGRAAQARTHITHHSSSTKSNSSQSDSTATPRSLAQRITRKLRLRDTDSTVAQPKVNNLIETVPETGESQVRPSYSEENPLDNMLKVRGRNGAPNEYVLSIRPDKHTDTHNRRNSLNKDFNSPTLQQQFTDKPNLSVAVDAMQHMSGTERAMLERIFAVQQHDIATGYTNNKQQRSMLDTEAERKKGKKKTSKVCKVGDCTEPRYMDEKYCRVHCKADMVTNPNARKQMLSHKA